MSIENLHKLISFREATIQDIELLTYWDKQEHVIACDPDSDWNWGEELLQKPDWRQQWIFELESIPIGFLQIIDPAKEESGYWSPVEPNIRAIDIWIGEKKHLNKGYGTVMMMKAIAWCFSDPNVTKIIIDPLKDNMDAQRFYRRLGFQFVEERIMDGDECCIFELVRDVANHRSLIEQ